MQILYILSVISFIALVWAVVSITRHIRRGGASQSSSTANEQEFGPQPSGPTSSTGRRDPITSRNHSDWANLEKSIGKHDLGNTQYPQAANRVRPAPTKP